MLAVSGLIFGATYAFVQANLAQSWGFGRRGGHLEERQRPGDTNLEHSDRGDRPGEGLGHKRGRKGYGGTLPPALSRQTAGTSPVTDLVHALVGVEQCSTPTKTYSDSHKPCTTGIYVNIHGLILSFIYLLTI